ncbi:hypothetical protein SVAN01_00374 [Stagonosporopsis vannaccii]|nr:hypothetical protein SVAN01_00374 [Stagonosporopsis vannaccii]
MHLLPVLSTLLSVTAAISIPRDNECLGVEGVKAFLTNPAQGGPAPFNTVVGKGSLAACRSECFSAANAQCKTFSVRESRSGGACYLYDEDLSSKLKPNAESTYTYYVLPGGIRGDVPENVARHYTSDISKTKGNYEDCREFCLSQTRCKGFGFRDGGNCQLYDVSLRGKVKAKPTSLYIQYYADCNGV